MFNIKLFLLRSMTLSLCTIVSIAKAHNNKTRAALPEGYTEPNHCYSGTDSMIASIRSRDGYSETRIAQLRNALVRASTHHECKEAWAALEAYKNSL